MAWRRTRVVLGHAAGAAALSAVFVTAAGGAFVLHADLPATRRLVASVTNRVLGESFAGKLVVRDVTKLSLGREGHVAIGEVEVLDPDGQRVLAARDVDVRIDLRRLARSLSPSQRGGPDIALEGASIGEVDLVLDVDAAKRLRIARAFEPRKPAPPLPPEREPEPLALRLSIPSARVRHAHVHGNLVPPELDADADDLEASVAIDDGVLRVEPAGARVTLRSPHAPGQSGPLRGRVKGALSLPFDRGGPSKLHAELVDSDLAGVPFTARFGLDGDLVDAELDVPTATSAQIASALPTAVSGGPPPLAAPVSLHARATGKLSRVAVTARARVGEADVDVRGTIGLVDKTPFSVDADVSRFDAATVTGPKSDLTARLHAEGSLESGAPVGTFRLTSKEGAVAGQRTPVLGAEGTFDARRVTAKLRATEPGLEVTGSASLDIPDERASFDLTARASDLRAIARTGGVASGSATARAIGAVDLGRGTIAGRVTAEGDHLAHRGISAAHARVEASLSGPVASPVADVTGEAVDVALTAEGKKPLVYPKAAIRARVSLFPSVRVEGAELRVQSPEGGGPEIALTADSIHVTGGGVQVRGARVTGLGAPLEAEVHTTGEGAVSIKARGEGVDLERVAVMTGIAELRQLPPGARASFDVDLASRGGRTDGHADVTLTAEQGATAEVHARFEGRRLTGRARVAVPDLGWVDVTRAELEIPGAASARTLARATGSVELRGELDLEKVAALTGDEHIHAMKGVAELSARVERADASTLPLVSATVRTRGLDVTLGPPMGENGSAGEEAETRITGVDGSVHVLYDGATDDAAASFVTWDARGLLASGEAKARAPLVAWARGERTLDRHALAALDVSAAVDVAKRGVADLPAGLGPVDLRGSLSLHVESSGPLGRPRVRLVARADDVREQRPPSSAGGTTGAAAEPRYAPVDGALEATWDGDHVVAALMLDEAESGRTAGAGRPPSAAAAAADPAERAPRRSGHVRALVLGRVRAEDLLLGRPVAWNASAELDVADLELAPLPLPLATRGALTARASLHDLNGTPSLALHGRVADLGVGGARVESGDFDLDAQSGNVIAKANVHQSDGGGASVDVSSTALVWKGTSVEWDAARATRVDYVVDRLRLSIVRPLVRRSIPEIDGRLDGRGSASIDAGAQVFDGGLALSDGRMYVNAIGEEVTAISAIARFDRSGVFRVSDARAKIGTGEVKASVSGRMKGLHLDTVEAVIVVPSKDGVPISSEGATFAEATGEVKIAAKVSADRRQLLVAVTVPRARIELPDSGAQQLQPLDPDKTIAIGVRRADGSLAPALLRPPSARARQTREGEAAPLTSRFAVTLGDEVELEGRGLRLTLRGKTLVEIAREVAVSGQISLKPGGTIDVQGRKFVVDRGTVTFDSPDPADPTVVAAAFWDAPDRTRVWVEFSGSLKSGKLTLRSEPPYSKNEILSILLFGRPDPNMGSGGQKQSGAQQAEQLGGGVAAAGLSRALSELSDDVDLEQDRTSANRVRTKVGYRLRRNLKVQLGYASGFSQREPDTTYLFLEWQFAPKWSLVGTRGDKGTSIIDMLWQHRY